MQTEAIPFTTETLISLLQSTYLSHNNQQIAKATSTLIKYYNLKPLAFIQSLLSIIESNDYVNNPSIDDLKKSASKQLKQTSFKFAYLDHGSEQYKNNSFKSIVPRMYNILITPNLITTPCKRMVGEALISCIKSSNQFERQVCAKIFQDLKSSKDPYTLNSLKQLCLVLAQGRQNTEDMQFLMNNLLPLIKQIIAKYFEQFITNKDIENQKICLTIIYDYFSLLDSIFVVLSADQEGYGQILHYIKSDTQLNIIFIKILELGFAELGTIVITQQFSVIHPKINKVKDVILEAMEKIYIIDSIEALNMCIFSIFTCKSNYFSPQMYLQSQILHKCFNLLIKNIDFNQHYLPFSISTSYILIKCMILCKLSADDLLLIEEDPQKFIEATEDFCDSREEYSLRMKSAEFILAFCKKIDGSLIYVKTVCYDLLRNAYFNTKMVYEIQNTELFLSSDVIKKQVSLMILTLIFPLLKQSQDNIYQMKAFLLQMIQKFNDETQLLIQLRIINLIGYYVDINYLPYIAERVKDQPQILKFQCFSTLNRILRSTQISLQQGVYQFICSIFLNQIQNIKPQSKLFQTIVITNYSKLLQSYPQLKQMCIDKLVESIDNLASSYHFDKDQQVPFHYFLSLIQRQTDSRILQMMENKFHRVLQRQSRRQSTETNIFQIMTQFLSRSKMVNQIHNQFAIQLNKDFYQYYQIREFFLYINSYIYFNTSNDLPFEVLHEYLGIQIMHKDVLMSPITFIIGQMFYKHSDIIEMDKTVFEVLKYYEQCDLDITKGRLLNIILQGVMQNPNRILKIMGQDNYLFLIKQIANNIHYFQQPLDRKICTMGLCRLLQMEANNNSINIDILITVVRMLELQYSKKAVKQHDILQVNQEDTYDNEMQQENSNVVQKPINKNGISEECQTKINQMVEFDSSYYNKFLHPINSVNEYLSFQQLWETIKNLYIPNLNETQSVLVRKVLDIKKVGLQKDKTRRIVKIKRT